MKLDTLTIVGVGLIGGSIGLAARKRGVAKKILGVGRSRESLTKALARGAIDEAFEDIALAAKRSEVVVFCTPVDRIPEQVLQIGPNCPNGTLLLDAGSTKEAILKKIEGHLPAEVAFVGCHPLAGSEKRGSEHAEADLFEGRMTVITPVPWTSAWASEKATAFWQALGSQVRTMTPREHDEALARTSHLPHLVASALTAALPPELWDLTATGFRDTTRVAAGDPAVWTAIFMQNRSAVLAALQTLDQILADCRHALEAGDAVALDALLTQAKRVRDALGN